MRSVILLVGLLAFSFNNLHAEEQMHQHHAHTANMSSPLTAPGNDAFAAIQEVVVKLLANPDTDWSNVDLETLRQHLVDMQNFTFNVAVSDQKHIKGGIQFTVTATTPAAAASLGRLFSAHPAILKQESGWDMSARKNNNGSFTATVTTDKKQDVAKIRGLGYIGVVAYGQHHQQHHWMMATGMNPHHGH